MTLLSGLSGCMNSKMDAPFIIFMNKNSDYLIIGIPNNVSKVSYSTGPRGWMDRRVFVQWLKESRAIDTHPAGQPILLFDNCSGHKETPMQL